MRPPPSPSDTVLRRVEGTFFRAYDPVHESSVLSGSVRAGRYSSAKQPTLYLSASLDGVRAAMSSHRTDRSPDLHIARFRVRAHGIFDLRDEIGCQRAGIVLADATAPWQDIVARGGVPSSWGVRRRIEALGGQGLIDPSRSAQGLWHLVLFRWNDGRGAVVERDESRAS